MWGTVWGMDSSTLARVMGNVPGVDYTALAPGFNEAMVAAGVTTVRRAAMWCAQLGHESVGLRYMREIWGPTPAQRGYEGRADLGNTRPGDGKRFMGRGPIQVTGRHNYTRLSQWAHKEGLVPTPTFFVDNPTELEKPRYGFLGAVWYWTTQRPLNRLSDAGDLTGATRAINGGTNGINDRRARYTRALAMGESLLPERFSTVEKVLPYPRDQVTQDTIYNCGPASVQTIIRSKTGKLHTEATLGSQLGTHRGGTDYIGQFPTVLNRHLPGAGYRHQDMPNDPPTPAQRDKLWRDLTGSINAGYGVVANIVAPPNNYPRASYKSTVNLAYGGGTVYHYVAVMGYATDSRGTKHVWLADSGFPPYGSWITFDQLASLIPPKGYAYATAKTTPPPPQKAPTMDNNIRRIEDQLAGPERNKNGNPTFKGWGVADVIKAGKTNLTRYGTCTPVQALFIIGEETLTDITNEGKK